MSLHRFIRVVSDANKVRDALGEAPLDVKGMMELASQYGITVVHETIMGLWGDCDRSDGLHYETCVNCGVRFGIDATFWRRSLVNHTGGCPPPEGFDGGGWFSCPNGCRQRMLKPAMQLLGDRCVDLAFKLETAGAKLEELTAGTGDGDGT